MPNKLQELTDKLYNEGLSKGKEEGAQIVKNAQSEATSLIEKAKAEAEAIIEKAKKEAEDTRSKVESNLQTAASQLILTTKKDIENLVISKMVDGEVKGAMSNPEFIKGIISTIAEKFSTTESSDLQLIMPESLKKDLEPFIKDNLSKVLKNGVEASFSEKISGGFRIAPKDGSYFISITEDTVKELISEYLRPATKKILFG